MSEYQYYEFCKMGAPLTATVRKEMNSLSSRAKVTTHSASYVYNYGDFRGNPKQLLLKHFDVFFYIANWGSLQLMFKYHIAEVNVNVLKKYCIDDFINNEIIGEHVLLNIDFNNEEGFSGWIDGERMLAELLPLYDEIKSGNYQMLQILKNNYDKNMEVLRKTTSNQIADTELSKAQQAFLTYAELDRILHNE